MSQKRIRSVNWDDEEKELFLMVFKDYAKFIENKSLDTKTCKAKTKAWEQVYLKFNKLNRRPRNLNQLKIQWKTMKVTARKSINDFKKEANKTGGGIRPPTPDDTIMFIKDLLNTAELMQDEYLYDSEGVMTEKVETTTTNGTHNAQNSKLLNRNSNMEDPLSITEDEAIADLNKSTTPGQKDIGVYVNSIITHSKMLKEEEHSRRMQMAEEEHAIKMEIHKENLKSAALQREILELKKANLLLQIQI